MSETVKPFTDEDLKQFVEVSGYFFRSPSAPHIWQSVPALLARLAAAEDLATGVRNDSRLSAIYKVEVLKWLATRGIGI